MATNPEQPPIPEKEKGEAVTLTPEEYELLHNAELLDLMNEKGINSIMAMIESIVHQTNSLSNFDEKDLEFYFDTLKSDLITTLMINRLDYDIDRKNRSLIVGNAMRFGWGFIKKSFEEGERKFWKGSVQEVKHTQETNKVGGFSLNPFKSWR